MLQFRSCILLVRILAVHGHSNLSESVVLPLWVLFGFMFMVPLKIIMSHCTMCPVKEKKNILTLHKIVRKTLLGTSMIVVKTIAETSGSTVDSVKTTGDL